MIKTTRISPTEFKVEGTEKLFALGDKLGVVITQQRVKTVRVTYWASGEWEEAQAKEQRRAEREAKKQAKLALKENKATTGSE